MQVNLPGMIRPMPLLCDLPSGAEFMFEEQLYIKHESNGSAYYKCYNLNKKGWTSLSKSCRVDRVEITCSAQFI